MVDVFFRPLQIWREFGNRPTLGAGGGGPDVEGLERMKCDRQLIGALALGVALVCGPTPSSATASGARSLPEDRQRFVSIARDLEQAPLKPGARADRSWAVQWLTDAPDVSVTVCGSVLGDVAESDYAYAGEIVLQDMFSMAAFAIEHPEAAKNANAQQLAGMEGALNAYRSILRDKPDAKLSALDKLLQAQSRGELPEFILKASISCSAKK